MSIQEMKDTITAKVWQATAQSGIDLSSVPEDDLKRLIDTVIDAALDVVNDQMEQISQTMPSDPELTDDEESVLWKGRPHLSLTTRYIITSERISIIEGIMTKYRNNVELVRVQDIDYKQNLGERALNIGDIFIESSDPKMPKFMLENVKSPSEVQEILWKAVRGARKRHGFTFREDMAS